MMRASALLSLLLLLSLPVRGEPVTVEQLSWLSGQWLGQEGERRMEEHYMRPAGGVIVGMSRTVRPGREPEVEFIRIAPGPDGQLAYHAHPLGQSPARFPLVESGPGLAVFANPAHDFPQKITYRRTGDRLSATIEGPGKDGKPKQFGWSWTWAGAAP